jgi:hypothetical protein
MAVDDQARARRPARSDLRGSEPPCSPPPVSRVRALGTRLTAGGTDGNERLSTATGVALLILLAALGVTILRIRPLLSVHMFLGILLIPPIVLKMASTGYRFVRYYTSDPCYRRRGAPPTMLRLIAPVVVTSTVVVFATGVALLLVGPQSRGLLLPVHKVSFILWLAVTTIHVLGHLGELSRTLNAGRDGRPRWNGGVSGRGGRILSVSGVLVAGLVLAIVYLPQFGPWLHVHH